MVQRFFLSNFSEFLSNQIITKENNEDTFHHLKNVLRIRLNQQIDLVVNGKVYLAEVINVTNEVIDFKIINKSDKSSELPVQITLIVPFLKNDKTDWFLQKATEMGVTNIILTNFRNSVVKLKDDKKIERFKKIVKAAAEQSKRLIIPDIKYVDSMNKINFLNYETKIIAYEESAKNEEKTNLAIQLNKKNQNVVAVFGPEGGIDQSEIDYLKDNDFTAVGLGPRILRAETAPLYFLSVLSFVYEMS
ncbi:MAG: 16S rRNA (uracil(1498)-N(3))-methyltransferase [Lactobacillaceae bacterium]|jgi:16S rRNA (uracil1498-N3)-methyltransferase|nr:16S rRNA (uracil(1498)-N(3))-methyltransferase [Lactobacillaceae bacterium]